MSMKGTIIGIASNKAPCAISVAFFSKLQNKGIPTEDTQWKFRKTESQVKIFKSNSSPQMSCMPITKWNHYVVSMCNLFVPTVHLVRHDRVVPYIQWVNCKIWTCSIEKKNAANTNTSSSWKWPHLPPLSFTIPIDRKIEVIGHIWYWKTTVKIMPPHWYHCPIRYTCICRNLPKAIQV